MAELFQKEGRYDVIAHVNPTNVPPFFFFTMLSQCFDLIVEDNISDLTQPAPPSVWVVFTPRGSFEGLYLHPDSSLGAGITCSCSYLNWCRLLCCSCFAGCPKTMGAAINYGHPFRPFHVKVIQPKTPLAPRQQFGRNVRLS